MNPNTSDVLLILLLVAVPLLVAWLLNLVWSREQVKKDLRRQGLAPLHVRWRPFGEWKVFFPYAFAFEATFANGLGGVETARCVVHSWLHTVTWVRSGLRYLDANLSPALQLFHLVGAGAFVWIALKLLFTGSLRLPTRVGPWTWHGPPVILLSLAALCAAANLLATVAFCRLRQADERRWTRFARSLGYAGWTLLVASGTVALWQEVSK